MGSKIIIHQIQTIHRDATRKITSIRPYLKHRPNIVYRADDDVSLGIPMNKPTHTRIPTPTLSPTNSLIASHHLVNRIKVFDAVSNDYKAHKKRRGS